MDRKKERSTLGSLMPAIGFVVAVGLGVLAFFLSPELIKFMGSMNVMGMTESQFYAKLAVSPTTIVGSGAHIAISILIWGVTFSVMMVLVAGAIGTAPDHHDAQLVRPPESDRKAMKKYYERLEKHKKKMAKQALEYQKRKEKEAKKNKKK